MGDKSKVDAKEHAKDAPGPGDPNWESNRQVIHGETEEQMLHQADVDKDATDTDTKR